jgi:hypothetical protein
MMMMMIIIIIIIMSYRKQPYWALHTYFGKCKRKRTKEPTQELEIEAP